MNLTLSLDVDDPDEIGRAITMLQLLLPDPTAAPKIEDLILAIADNKKYGIGRLGYLAAVAAAGDDGAAVDSLLHDHFGGNYQSFGGTHASIEKSWRRLGGATFATKLIDD